MKTLVKCKEHVIKCQKAGISSSDIWQTLKEFMEVTE